MFHYFSLFSPKKRTKNRFQTKLINFFPIRSAEVNLESMLKQNSIRILFFFFFWLLFLNLKYFHKPYNSYMSKKNSAANKKWRDQGRGGGGGKGAHQKIGLK